MNLVPREFSWDVWVMFAKDVRYLGQNFDLRVHQRKFRSTFRVSSYFDYRMRLCLVAGDFLDPWISTYGLPRKSIVDITEFFMKLKFVYHWADPFKDLKWSNVPGVKLSSLSESDDTFSSLQALSDLYYLFGGFMDYLWSRELDISNFSPIDRPPIEFLQILIHLARTWRVEYFDIWDTCMIKSSNYQKVETNFDSYYIGLPFRNVLSNAMSIPRSVRDRVLKAVWECTKREPRAGLLIGDSLLLNQSLSKYSNLEVGRINHRSWVIGNDSLREHPRVLGLLVPLLELNLFEILLGELEGGRIASSGWPFVFAVPGMMTHLVASLTLDSASWVNSISPDGFLPSIMLLLVIIVVVSIVVTVVLVVVVVGEGQYFFIKRCLNLGSSDLCKTFLYPIGAGGNEFHQDKASSLKTPLYYIFIAYRSSTLSGVPIGIMLICGVEHYTGRLSLIQQIEPPAPITA
ncbi:hypothetical protein Tco_0650134 [Tanacetum coccineum]